LTIESWSLSRTTAGSNSLILSKNPMCATSNFPPKKSTLLWSYVLISVASWLLEISCHEQQQAPILWSCRKNLYVPLAVCFPSKVSPIMILCTKFSTEMAFWNCILSKNVKCDNGQKFSIEMAFGIAFCRKMSGVTIVKICRQSQVASQFIIEHDWIST